uniref:Uncharacterized protein n=1 Tax=Glossina pallidipes TaxID=7398 RepID=A0A1B0A604_GLOPL
METSCSSCTDANSPTDTVCSSESSAMMCKSHLQYDQHSSEEELEVINGPSSVAAAEAAAAAAAASNVLVVRGTSSLISERGSSSLDPDELHGDASALKRSSSTLAENRKRSLAHSSDDDLRNSLEPILTPVNFRTSPPLEAFKPNRSHMYRSTTPLILQEARCGIENIKLCDNSVNDENGANNGDSSCAMMGTDDDDNVENQAESSGCASSIIKLKMSNSTSSHHIYQPQAKHNFHFNSSRSSPASTTGLDVEVRSSFRPLRSLCPLYNYIAFISYGALTYCVAPYSYPVVLLLKFGSPLFSRSLLGLRNFHTISLYTTCCGILQVPNALPSRR